MEFGARLKKYREDAGLTQSELAEGISAASYISLLESGKRKPTPDLILKFATRLKIPPIDLAIEEEDRESAWSLNVAQVAFSSGNLEIAKERAEQLLAISAEVTSATLGASVILLQIMARKGNFEGILDELEQLFIENPLISRELRSRIGNEIINVCFRSGNFGLGALRGEEMFREFGALWPETEIVELLCLVASCHYHRGDTQRAYEVVARALALAEICKSPKAIVQSQWQSSMLAESRGDLSLALSHIKTAMHWTKLAELDQVLPILNDNAAKIMLALPNPDLKYIHNLAESAYLDLASQNNPGHAAYACVTLSEVEIRLGNYEGALSYLRKGQRELPATIAGPKVKFMILESKVLFLQSEVKESELALAKTVSYMEKLPPSNDMALYWGEVASLYVEMGLPDQAIFSYQKALSSISASSIAEHEILLASLV